MSKPQLILDIGGVLVSNFSPSFWQELSSHSSIPYDVLVGKYKEVRQELWTGQISEEEFWSTQFPSIHADQARDMLHSHLQPLPAIEYLPQWSQYVDIHLLSNHRTEWINPVLHTVRDHVQSVTISSEAGCCKPHPDIYTKVTSQLMGSHRIVFVDDQDKNFMAATNLGWKTLLADSRGEWVKKVLPMLIGR